MNDTKPRKIWTRAEVETGVIATIVTEGMAEAEKVTPEATIESLEIDSIDFVMILNGLEEYFDLYVPVDQEVADLKTVNDLTDEIHRRLTEAGNV